MRDDDDLLDDDELEDEEPSPSDDSDEPGDWDPAAQVVDDAEYAESYYSHWHELIDEEVRFVLDSEQHEVDLGHTQNPDEIQAKDLSLLSTERRKWSQIGAAPIHLRTHPVDMLGDPLAAERTRWVIEREIYSSRNLFRRKRKRAIIGAVVGRLWYLTMEWDADIEEIVYDTLAPADVLKCPGFIDAHDPLCPWVIIRKRPSVAQARAFARQLGLSEEEVREIKADSDSGGTESSHQHGTPSGATTLDHTSGEGGPAIGLRDVCEMLIAMYRVDPERIVIEQALGPPEPLPEDQWLMRCWECGYETLDHPMDAETGKLPRVGEACPECSARMQVEAMQAMQNGAMPMDPSETPMLERVDSVEEVERFPKYPNGRWIVVLRETRKVLYNDAWPYLKPDGGTLRSFPIGEYRIYDDPRHEFPHSDTSWQWNQQALATYMLQWAVDQMRTSGRIIMMPKGALVDSRGRAYTPTNRIDQVVWMKDPMLAKAVQEFQPRGLPQGWTELYQSLQGSFRANLGTGELGLGPEQSKDIAVGTVRAITESGDIPIDDAISMVREEDTMVLGIIADMAQCCWTRSRWVRYLGQDGAIGYEYFSGAALTGVDVEIMASPHMDQQRAAELQTWQTFFMMTPPQQRIVAKLLNLNPSEVYQYQQDQQMFMMTGGLMPGPAPGGAPSGGGVGGPAGAAPLGAAPAPGGGNPPPSSGAEQAGAMLAGRK